MVIPFRRTPYLPTMLIVITVVVIPLLQLKVTISLTIMVAVDVKLTVPLFISRKVKPPFKLDAFTLSDEKKVCEIPVEISSRHDMTLVSDTHVKTTVVPGHTVVLLESFVTSCVSVTEQRERERKRKRERDAS